MFFVYLIHNTINSKYYVGYTNDFSIRWYDHCYDARAGSDFYFHRAIRFYNSKSFTHEILNIVNTAEEAKALEKLWIITLQAYNPEFGYNMTMGGDGVIPTFESRKKLSLALIGRKKSLEHTERNRISHIGITYPGRKKPSYSTRKSWPKFSDERKANLSKVMKLLYEGGPHPLKGKIKGPSPLRGRKVLIRKKPRSVIESSKLLPA